MTSKEVMNTFRKSALSHNTAMSLDQRFTQLRGADARLLVRGVSDLRQYASTKSRRLALQMSRRPAVLAALSTRRGLGGNLGRRGIQIGRGGFRNFGRGRRSNSVSRGGIRPLRRSGSIGRLARSQSLTSLNSLSVSPFRTRSRGRGRGVGGRGAGNFQRSSPRQRGGRFVGFGLRRGRGSGGAAAAVRGSFGTNRARGVRGTGRRGFGGRGRRGQRPPPPSKEKLDMELDEYMASSRATLDKEIDTYMSQTQEKWE